MKMCEKSGVPLQFSFYFDVFKKSISMWSCRSMNQHKVCYTLHTNICFVFQMVNVQMDIDCVRWHVFRNIEHSGYVAEQTNRDNFFFLAEPLYSSENASFLLWMRFNGGDQSNSMEFQCKRMFLLTFFALFNHNSNTNSEGKSHLNTKASGIIEGEIRRVRGGATS